MPVTYTGWSGSQAQGYGFTIPPAAAQPLQIPVATTAGDWLVAIVTWRQPQAGQGVSICVADDAHNWWEPLGAPTGDSSAAGVTRTAIWYAPAARVARFVQIAPTGPCVSIAALVLDLNGMSPWKSLSALHTGNTTGTSLSLSTGAPASQALFIAAAGSDNNTFTVTGPGVAWVALPSISATNGTDTLSDITLTSGLLVTTGTTSAAWSSTGSLDMSGIIAGLLITVAAPVQSSPGWPIVITEAAIGSGPQTPPALMSWTALSPRQLETQVQQGRQYTLSQLQAGQGTMRLDNPDGALIPPGSGSFAGIDSGTPVRQRLILPNAVTPYYVPFSGFFKRWPFAVPVDMLRGESSCELTDIWGYAAGSLDSMARQEMLLDNPYALWPLSDPAGSTAGSNLAAGNANPLTLVTSKYGAAGATAVFGSTPGGGSLPGDTSARITSSGKTTSPSGMFEQTLPALALTGAAGYGFALGCADTAYPPLSGGVTIETWAQGNEGTVGFTNTGNTITTASSTFTTGQPITFEVAGGFTLPTGVTTGVVYWVINASGSTFQVSATLGGSVITLSTNGGGFVTNTTPYNPVIFSTRNVKGQVVSLTIRDTDGALLLAYQTASGSTTTVTVSTAQDFRTYTILSHYSVAITRTTWRVLVNGGGTVTASGTFSSSLPAYFDEAWFGGVQDRATQGLAYPGWLGLAAIYPGILPQTRVISHWGSASYGLRSDTAATRIERAVEYAGVMGRRLILQQSGLPYGQQDDVVPGSDVGGNSGATMASNIATSTVPALLYVAPTGDVVYWSKQYAYNQAVNWVLGDNVAGGEIPFSIGQFSTDYDPSRVVNDVQLTELETSSLTVPAGVMSSTTVAAIEAAAQQQYGDVPYQQTGYLQFDYNAAYGAGSSLLDLANWVAMVYRKPANRVQAVTVEAAAANAGLSASAKWQLWAGASVGDMVTVNVRLPTAATSPLISLTARITQTSRAMKWSTDEVKATIGFVLDFAPEYNALTCDDAVRGLLNGTNVLAW